MTMKKLFVLVIVFALAWMPAGAETREGVIWLEGEPEEIVETLYESALGFSFWYDADLLAVTESDESVTVRSRTLGDIIYMEIMPPETAGVLPWKYLELNAAPDTEYAYNIADSGAEIHWFQKLTSEDGWFIDGYYAVDVDESFAVASAHYPAEAEEGFGAYFRSLIWSIRFAGDALVRAGWAEDVLDGFAAWDEFTAGETESSTRVAFWTAGRAAHFRVLALSCEGVADDGRMLFSTEEVYVQDELTAERPLVVAMTFYGDIPNNGISYVDESGAERMFAVDMSGEDGSVLLWEFNQATPE